MFFSKVPTVSWCDVPKGAHIVDVREPHEYKLKSIVGSKNYPLSRIESFRTINTVYVNCQSGMRSKKAVKIMRKNGINAINIKGGMVAYGK